MVLVFSGHYIRAVWVWVLRQFFVFLRHLSIMNTYYVADEHGYRVVESNAVPISSWGAKADGNQGSFVDYESEGGAKQ
ncbi:hypothetical protein Hamer_G023992 [Homarus americanus]|uniref:Uncharacterized protein n=1 Tax=Homarus americanus TaxID=6706 RepID=A0A8J5N095_HOMAM|nr:hypothetical protein Hamer_G023992 [Homarus americanus]